MTIRTGLSRLAALLLSLVLIVSAIPGASAASLSSDAAYYGDKAACAMDGPMAYAYAQKLNQLAAGQRDLRAMLLDLSGDGYPLLLTAPSWGGLPGAIRVWAWNGSAVTADPVGEKISLSLGTLNGQSVLRIQSGTAASPLGQSWGTLYYRAQEGRLHLYRQELIHTARIEDNGTYAATDHFAGMRVSTEDLKAMGWVPCADGKGLMIASVNSDLVPLSSESALSQWQAQNDKAFRPYADQVCSPAGGGTLSGTWNAAGALAAALEIYAREDCRTAGTFLDIPSGHFAAKAVDWALGRKVTNGTSELIFSPNATCTTGQILTFLYRAAGEPSPTIEDPFPGLDPDAYYYRAVLWSYEKGLISGTEFAADVPCSRAETVTYLWKLVGSPIQTGSSFLDVPADAPYADAVVWAVNQGITNGTGPGYFSPESTCSRAQIVTFLYRAYVR